MNIYGNLLLDALSQESAQFDNEKGYVPQGDVLIEFPDDDSDLKSEVIKIADSLESKGWKVHIPSISYVTGYSPEGSSDGVNAGLPSMNADNAINNVVNGVYVPELKPSDIYQVVQVVRPEDTVQSGMSKILYLMNGEGDIKDMLREEGHLVVDEKDALHLMLKGETAQ